MTKKRVILFKKQDINDEYNELFLKNDYIAEFIPVLDHKSNNVEIIKNILLQGPEYYNYTGLILTSQRSVQAMKEALDVIGHLPQHISSEWNELCMYIVGPQTAKCLLELSLFNNDKKHPWIIAPRASELTPLIINDQHNKKLLFLAGDKRRDFIPTELTNANIKFDEVQSYITCPHNDLSKNIQNLPFSDWIIYFSPSGLKFILSSIDTSTKQKFLATSVNIAAIGPTTADYILEQYNHPPNVMADHPDAHHLIQAILQFDSKEE
jgi:uroporphyrinogen-III synthase